MHKAVLVLDCGATNVKASLVDTTGQILASHALPNETIPDPYYKGGLIWDIEAIWNKLARCSRKACQEAENHEIAAITVTTFGVDGAAMKKDGSLCYPVISWQCKRTEEAEKKLPAYIDPQELRRITGIKSYHFNTINKLIWLQENKPDVLDKADYYVLMPSILLHRMTGEFVTDTTMAGTTMLTNLKTRRFSTEILEKLALGTDLFPPLVEPGTIVGKITSEAAGALGVKTGTDVIAAGHDTQFAILGSGAGIHQPVLSSGTWEILMARTMTENLLIPESDTGITVELDAQPGVADLGVQWIASGALEWIRRMFYSNPEGNIDYSVMIQEAGKVPAGCEGVIVLPEFFPGKFLGNEGMIRGITHETSCGHVYRATLEALSFYTRYGLEKLTRSGNFSAGEIICVGGGSRNSLWNQIRADVLNKPVKCAEIKESTVLGAAMTAFTGKGFYPSLSSASRQLTKAFEVTEPGENAHQYEELYGSFLIKA
ncbi:MAG: L-fuculokinase, partial [Bacteroidales bacterium]|nr:L-fuculokinase [Bacteroidales bacterium]